MRKQMDFADKLLVLLVVFVLGMILGLLACPEKWKVVNCGEPSSWYHMPL